MTDFKRVLVADRLAWELFGLAARERFLYRRNSNDAAPEPRKRSVGQRVLSLIVLFDQLIVHEFGEADFRLPDLESDGVVQIVPRSLPSTPVAPIRAGWRRGPLKQRKAPPRSLLKSLQLFREERPLVVERLLATPSDFDKSMASALGVSRRKYVDALLDYSLACVTGDQEIIASSIMQRLPDDFLSEITNTLFDFGRLGDSLDPVNATLLFATAFADEVRIIQELSNQFGVGVATEHYRSRFTSHTSTCVPSGDAVDSANHFLVVRTALAEARGVVPRVLDIRHALALRRDPNLRSFRRLLAEFHEALQQGDVDAVGLARREISRSRQAIERRAKWQRGLDWVAYLSLPVGITETLIGNLPIASTGLAVLGAGGNAALKLTSDRNGWVLFTV